MAFVRERAMLDMEDLLAERCRRRAPLLLALDGVEDPQNLGALLRTADGAGVTGVVLTERRSAPLSAVALKASAGAAEHVRIARVVNLVRALEQVKAANIWCVGLDERGTMDYTEYDFTSPCLLVLGREGAGLHDLVRRTCDHLLRIPMAGKVASLNVSAAGAVVLYEAYRQRRRGPAADNREGTSRRGSRAKDWDPDAPAWRFAAFAGVWRRLLLRRLRSRAAWLRAARGQTARAGVDTGDEVRCAGCDAARDPVHEVCAGRAAGDARRDDACARHRDGEERRRDGAGGNSAADFFVAAVGGRSMRMASRCALRTTRWRRMPTIPAR